MLENNFWIYLTNNLIFNSKGDAHFVICKGFNSMSENGTIVLYITSGFYKEWKRYQNISNKYIRSLEDKLSNLNEIIGIEYLIGKTEALEKVKVEYQNAMRNIIERNKEQLRDVESLLSKCIPIPISDNVKEIVISLAVDKKPPFHNSKSNVNDALNLFSFDEYVKTTDTCSNNEFIFVSKSHSDYCISGNISEIHPDIRANITDKISLKSEDKISEILELSIESTREFKDDWNKLDSELDNNVLFRMFNV